MYHTLSRVRNVKFKSNLFKELKIEYISDCIHVCFIQLDSIRAKLFY